MSACFNEQTRDECVVEWRRSDHRQLEFIQVPRQSEQASRLAMSKGDETWQNRDVDDPPATDPQPTPRGLQKCDRPGEVFGPVWPDFGVGSIDGRGTRVDRYHAPRVVHSRTKASPYDRDGLVQPPVLNGEATEFAR